MEEQIIEKIRKLLALAGSDNENEAQNAMLMAQKLMAKHNIEMSQVKDHIEDHEVIEQDADKKAHCCGWKRWLARVIANNFRCETYLIGYRAYKTVFIGKKDTIEICKIVYNSAVRFIDLNFTKYWNEKGKWKYTGWGVEERPLSDAISEKNDYALGFLNSLEMKFESQKVEANKEGWGLVLVKDADVVSYKEHMNFSKGKFSKASLHSTQAYNNGYQDCQSKFGETGQKSIGD